MHRLLRMIGVLGPLAATAVLGPGGSIEPARASAAGVDDYVSVAAGADGYVWASQPTTANYLATTGYEHNSSGGDIEITRDGTGRYRVRFEGMGTAGGVAHATAHGATTGFCAIASWVQSGADEVLSVRCFDADGAPADLRFLAHFTSRRPGGTFAYFWSNQASPAGSYTPTASYRYDSTGAAPTVERVAVGEYFVYVGAVDDIYPDYKTGRFQVTAYGTAAVHCQQGTVNDELPAPITVRCYDADGERVDSRFAFSYARAVNLLGTDAPNATAWILRTTSARNPTYHWLVAGWSSPGEEPTLSHLDTGVFMVTFPGFSGDRGYPTAGAYTNGPGRCHVVGAATFGSDEFVIVTCVDGLTGEAADVAFTVAFLP